MKKGFTLIELLAVIAILAIIMFIATPRVLDAIENSRISAYQQDEQMMVKATKTYFGNNVDLLPENIGDTVEITLTDLKNKQLISNLSDQSGTCDGYILVTKTEEGYSYNPELKCGDSNTTGDSTTDGLVAHYTFDDFQEYTQNHIYFQNARVDQSYESYEVTTEGTWLEKHPDAIRVYNIDGTQITGYVNSGVTDWTNTYHAIWSYDSELKKPVVVMRDFDGIWKAKYFPLAKSFNQLGLSAGDKYTISWLQWTDTVDKRANVGIHGKNSSGEYAFWDGTGGGQVTSKNTELNTWQRVYATFTVTSDWNMDHISHIYFYGHNYASSTGTLKIADVQFETKSYTTPFVNGVRNSIIKDYSLNSNSTTLNLDATPRWMEENGNGYYNFDGINNYINIPSSAETQISNNLTISTWIKPSSTQESLYPRILDKGRYLIHIDQNPPYILAFNKSTASGTRQILLNNTIVPDEWSFVSVTYDGQIAKIYLNGNLVLEKDYGTVENLTTGAEPLYLGSNASDDRRYKGNIDDLKIYNRVLSEEEIKYQYDTKKAIYK